MKVLSDITLCMRPRVAYTSEGKQEEAVISASAAFAIAQALHSRCPSTMQAD